jgi:ACS family tartrate transporter-like MFS transporter
MSEDAIFLKCALRLIPLMGGLYLANYIDRVNAGFAALTMNKDLGFSPTVFGWGAGVFFVGYLLFQVPANAVLERAGARRTVFWIMAIWGAVSASTAFVQGPLSFYALRFLLGVAEAGFFPGMIFYLTLWFPKAYRTRFASIFLCAIPLSGIVGAPLSAYILELDGILGLHGWQWLFLLEGLPASVLAFTVLRWLPDNPAQAVWLNAKEKSAIEGRLALETTHEMDLWAALIDPRVWAVCGAAFTQGCALYGTGLWLPQIVKAMGFSNAGTGIVVLLCYLVAMAAMIAWGYSSDKRDDRIWHSALAWLLGAAGFLVAALAQTNAVALSGLALAIAATLAVIGPYITIVPTFLKGAAAAAGIALVNAFVSLGGFAGPVLIGMLSERSGDYRSAMAVLAAGLVLAALIVIALGRAMAARTTVTAQQTRAAE